MKRKLEEMEAEANRLREAQVGWGHLSPACSFLEGGEV